MSEFSLFTADTRICTADCGIKAISDLPPRFKVYDNKEYHDCTLTHDGPYPVREITFNTARGRSRAWKICTPRVRLWDTIEKGVCTYDIRLGDIVPPNSADQGYDSVNWLAGVLSEQGDFDGSLTVRTKALAKYLNRLRELSVRQKGDTFWFGFSRKPTLPLANTGTAIGSFIRGVFAATYSNIYLTADKERVKFLQDNAALGGYLITGDVYTTTACLDTGKEKVQSDIYNVYYKLGSEVALGFKCVALGETEELKDCYSIQTTASRVSTGCGISIPV